MDSLIEKTMDPNAIATNDAVIGSNPTEPESWEDKAVEVEVDKATEADKATEDTTVENDTLGDFFQKIDKKRGISAPQAVTKTAPTDVNEPSETAVTAGGPPPKPVLAADNLQLHDSWVLYYHDKNNDDWSLASYEEKHRFKSVGDCFRLFNNLRSVAFDMFFLMRDTYPPIWEHPKNIRGGGLSFKIHKKNVDNFWLTACFLMVGETICQDPGEVVGISVSPKVNHPTVRLWFRDQKTLPMIEKTLNPQLIDLSDSYIVRKHQIG